MIQALRKHWPEYLIEAWALGTFMISASLFTALLEYPRSPVYQMLPHAALRHALNGLAMGLTAISIIYSRWGQQSGAHMNPAFTLTFLWLRKIHPRDAVFYAVAQTAGGVAGILMARLALGKIMTDPTVNWVVTVPGPAGLSAAFAAETIIAGGLMLMVLWVTNTPRLARYTGLFAGALVALYITVEAPLSGMSINPARTVASALPSGIWTAGWVYFTAPILGMLLAAGVYRVLKARLPQACPKYHHGTERRCIFCGYEPGAAFSTTRRGATRSETGYVSAPGRK